MRTTSIPAFHVLGLSKAKGKGDAFTFNDRDATSSRVFHIDMDVSFDPATDDYPAGTLSIQTDMNDGAKGIFIASTIELINSYYGKQDPTIYLTGQCKSTAHPTAPIDGCRYWLMVVNDTKDNNRTRNIVGFCIQDRNGNRIAYGAGL
jgi:hypothetical protein